MQLIDFFDKHPWIPNILTIIVTVSIAIWQISCQFKNTIASQRASKLDELHLPESVKRFISFGTVGSDVSF